MRELKFLSILFFGFLTANVANGSNICQSYIKKVSKQLDRCGPQKLCLDAAFYHALNTKNYGTRYIHCRASFDVEVAQRIGVHHTTQLAIDGCPFNQAMADQLGKSLDDLCSMHKSNSAVELSQPPVEQPIASQPIPEAPVHPAELAQNCDKAYSFFRYATKSCQSPGCVNQQFQNTIKIPVFAHCAESLLSLKSHAEANPPGTVYHYQYGKYGKVPVKGQPAYPYQHVGNNSNVHPKYYQYNYGKGLGH